MAVAEPVTLVLGPALRYVDETTVTVWVETSGPVEISVLGRSARTFAAEGHHYAIVVVDGLPPGSDLEYSVHLNATKVWPEPGDARPAPRVRTLSRDRDLELVFGSCRDDRSVTEQAPLPGPGVDALEALSVALQAGERPLPDLMLLLGDQIYADYHHEFGIVDALHRTIGAKPRAEARTFDEYASIYRRSWGQADIRWLMATVPSAMILDDHEVRDNWNVSATWRREVTALPEWREQITGAGMAYWLYQHAGNLSPAALREEGIWRALTASPAGVEQLRQFSLSLDEEAEGDGRYRLGYQRDLGRSRLVVLDTRSSRVLEKGSRSMFSEPEWAIVEAGLRGDCEHLLVATSVPLLLHRSQHDAEAWNEAMCEGTLGSWVARRSERIRRSGNLDQWAAFQTSFRRMVRVLGEVASGQRGSPPTTVLVLSGDVHHAYVAPLTFRSSAPVRSPVVQLVSSPFRNRLSARVRWWLRFAGSRPARLAARLLARSAGVPDPPADWSVTPGPLFGNFVGSVTLEPNKARVRLDRAEMRGGRPVLDPAHEELLPQGTHEPGE